MIKNFCNYTENLEKLAIDVGFLDCIYTFLYENIKVKKIQTIKRKSFFSKVR